MTTRPEPLGPARPWAARAEGLPDVVRRGARELRRVWRGVVGEDAYERYRAHVETCRARGDADHPLMSEREFWRDRTDRQDAHPQGRCC